MSTRSLIGAETENGIKMVYVHCDGYPDDYWGKVQTLQRLVAEHGLDRVVSTLLETPAGWSSFDGNAEQLSQFERDGRFELVPGFGVRHTLTEVDLGGRTTVQGNKEYATPEDAHEYWDTEFVYVITADGKLRWAPHWDAPWAELEWHDEELVGAVQR